MSNFGILGVLGVFGNFGVFGDGGFCPMVARKLIDVGFRDFYLSLIRVV